MSIISSHSQCFPRSQSLNEIFYLNLTIVLDIIHVQLLFTSAFDNSFQIMGLLWYVPMAFGCEFKPYHLQTTSDPRWPQNYTKKDKKIFSQ